MALTDILEKIKQEAEKRLVEIEKDFNDKKEKLIKENENLKKEIDKNMHDKIEEKSVTIIEKAETLASRESKNQLLDAKRELIQECFDEAIIELSQSKDYEEMMTLILKETDFSDDNVVIIPAKGKENLTKNAIKNSKKNYFLSDKSADIKGGLIIKTGKIEIDNSFETIIKNQFKGDLEIQLNKILF